MKYSNVVVAGGGVLGSQIAFQAAYCGFNVTIWLRSEGSIGRTQPKIDHLKQTYIEAIEQRIRMRGVQDLRMKIHLTRKSVLRRLKMHTLISSLNLIWLRLWQMQTL